jgi:hypothetical protein
VSCAIAAFEFDIASTAGWYSSIAGLLTGFALLAILLPLDHEAEREDVECTNAVVVFTCAFFALLVLSINYAVLAGRTAGGTVAAVAAHEQMLFGPTFGLATLLLLFGLNALLRTYGANREIFLPAQSVIILMTSVLGPVIVLALQFSNALDLQFFRIENAPEATSCSIAGMPDSIWINLAITGGAMAALLILAALGRRLRIPLQAPMLIAKLVLGFTVAATAWTAIAVPLLPVELVTSALFEHSLLALTAAATVGFAAAAHAGR